MSQPDDRFDFKETDEIMKQLRERIHFDLNHEEEKNEVLHEDDSLKAKAPPPTTQTASSIPHEEQEPPIPLPSEVPFVVEKSATEETGKAEKTEETESSLSPEKHGGIEEPLTPEEQERVAALRTETGLTVEEKREEAPKEDLYWEQDVHRKEEQSRPVPTRAELMAAREEKRRLRQEQRKARAEAREAEAARKAEEQERLALESLARAAEEKEMAEKIAAEKAAAEAAKVSPQTEAEPPKAEAVSTPAAETGKKEEPAYFQQETFEIQRPKPAEKKILSIAEEKKSPPKEPIVPTPSPMRQRTTWQMEEPAAKKSDIAPQKAPPTVRKTAVPTPVPARTDKKEKLANLTVEGLLNDIFGSSTGPMGHRWFNSTAVRNKGLTAKRTPKKEEETAEPSSTPAVTEPSVKQEEKRPLPPKKPAPQRGETIVEIPEMPEHIHWLQHEGGAASDTLTPQKPMEPAPKPRDEKETTENDFRLLLDLDYEYELGHSVGFEKIRDYHEYTESGHSIGDPRKRRAKKHHEYGSHAQDITFFKQYARRRKYRIINMSVAFLLLIFSLIYERTAFIHLVLGETFSHSHFMWYVLFGLVALFAEVFLLRRHLLGGFWHLITLSPTDHSITAVAVLLTYIYHFAILFFEVQEPTIYFSPLCIYLFALSLSDFFDWYRESAAFRVVSSRQPKFALVPRISVGNEEENPKIRLKEDEKDEKIYYTKTASFIRNYRANTEKREEHNHGVGPALIVTFAVALVLGFYSYAMRGSLYEVFKIVFLTLIFTLPAMSVLTTSLPMFFASLFCLKKKAAVIGEAPVYTCKGKATLVLPDAEVFEPMPHEQFEMVSGGDAPRRRALIRALLEKVGSPMVESVSVAEGERISPDTLTLQDVDDGGVFAVSTEDGSEIIMGNVAYLCRYGIRVSEKASGKHGDICKHLLCVSINRHLVALFLARYRLQERVENLLDLLDVEHVHLAVRSQDPGVQSKLLRHLSVDAPDPITVIKPEAGELDFRNERVDSSIVALGSAKEAVAAFAVVRRTARAVRMSKWLHFLSILLGVLLSAFSAFFGWTAGMTSTPLILFLFVGILLHAGISYFYFRDFIGE